MTTETKFTPPSCAHCKLAAAYLYKMKDGGKWATGCTAHWMQFRINKKVDGAGEFAYHIPKDGPMPSVPEGGEVFAAPASEASKAPKPDAATPSGDAPAGAPAKPKKERAPKAPREWKDLPPGKEQQAPRDGSVLAITLALMAKGDGATLEEVQKALDEAKGEGKHDALTLILWANENRGQGFTRDANGKITAQIPNPKAEKPKAAPKAKPETAPATTTPAAAEPETKPAA